MGTVTHTGTSIAGDFWGHVDTYTTAAPRVIDVERTKDQQQEHIHQLRMTIRHRDVQLQASKKEVQHLQSSFDQHAIKWMQEKEELHRVLDMFRKKDKRKRVVRRRHESHTN